MKTVLILAILLSAQSTFADGKKKTFRKTQEVSFDATDVDGVARTPDGAYLHQKKGIKFLPLYKVDKKFDQKIKDSPDHLR